MKAYQIIFIILGILILLFGVLILIRYMNNHTQEDSDVNPAPKTSCTTLGCPAGTKYVGSVNSDKYYTCDCHYADRILPENIVCFTSDAKAEEKGYIKLDC